ncbi:uncharacterized protein LOC131228056 [Magnolia sinica]|uniref:uncharacterized protein LOC131228056 n=1 Tax=Magnolia sinica TaxID=86752 RepID=UPI002657B8D2|nr:uncharacterized protein LOC131228056 [Magnolia sinica]
MALLVGTRARVVVVESLETYAHGPVIFAFHRHYGFASNTVAEAQAMLDGITLCNKLGLSSIVVESDSSVVVEAAMDPLAHCPWNIWYRLGAIHLFRRSFNICFRHIFREGNSMADALARMASKGCGNSFYCSWLDLPRKVKGLLVLDKVGLGYLRT